MTATTVWSIIQLDRIASDGGVIVAHWTVTSTEDDYTASAYGTASFAAPDPDAPGFIPYEDLTEDDVLGWVWNDGVDKDATEAALAANIAEQQNPAVLSGVPW